MCKIERIKTNFSMRQYINKLRAQGFKKLGSGCFASAYAKPNGRRVYRIGEMPLGDFYSSIGNHAYIDFIKEAIKHKDNPWFPKIYKVIIYEHSEKEHYLSVYMERLYSFGYKPIVGDEASLIENLMVYRKEFMSLFGNSMERKARIHFEQLLRVLKKLENKHQELDMHNGNIMRRKNGQFVVIDPIA